MRILADLSARCAAPVNLIGVLRHAACGVSLSVLCAATVHAQPAATKPSPAGTASAESAGVGSASKPAAAAGTGPRQEAGKPEPSAAATDEKGTSAAPDPGAKRGSGIDDARSRMQNGQSLFAQGRFEEAMHEFEAAYEAMPYSAFLYNAAFAAEKAKDWQRAIAQYEKFLVADPTSTDAAKIRETIARLKSELSLGASDPGTAAVAPADAQALQEVRSIVLIESDPAGAPVSIWERIVPTAAPFRTGAENAGWRKIVSDAATPKDFPLKVGHYQVVIDAFRDFRRSETSMNLSPGHVYTFKANLSQGEFLGFLRIQSPVEGAKVFLDDPPPHKSAPWTRTPHGGPINDGEHELWIEAPGYKPLHRKVTTPHGETVEIEAALEREDYGYLVVDGNVDIESVLVDGSAQARYSKREGAMRVKLRAGKHALSLEADGRKSLVSEVNVPRGQELGVHASLEPKYPRGKAIALGVIGAAAIGGGVYLHLEAEKPVGQPHSEDLSKVFGATRFAAFGLGGLLSGLSVFYSIYDPLPDSALKADAPRDWSDAVDAPKGDATPKKDAPSGKQAALTLGVAPIFGPSVGGVFVGGSF